jgi:hypothetical protein
VSQGSERPGASYAALGANADGFAVCWGVCSEDLAVPYEPWLEVCSQLVEHAREDVLASYLPDYGGEIGRVGENFAPPGGRGSGSPVV